MNKNIYTEEYSIGDIMTKSWEIFEMSMKHFFFIGLFIYLPINLIFFRILHTYSLQFGNEIVNNFISFANSLAVLLSIIPITFIVKYSLDGETINLKQIFKKSLPKLPVLIWTSLVATVLLSALFVMLVVPSVIYFIYWVFWLTVVILLDKSGKEALDYSKSIVYGRWKQVFGYFIAFAFLGIIFNQIVGVIFGLLGILHSDLGRTIIDFMSIYFMIIPVIFFVNFDSTKKIYPHQVEGKK